MDDILNKIFNEVNGMREEMTEMRNDIGNLKTGQDRIENTLIPDLKTGQDRIENKLIPELKTGQDRIENKLDKMNFNIISNIGDYTDKIIHHFEETNQAMNKNIISNIGDYTDKIIHHFDETSQALNKRVLRVETEIEKANRK